MSPSQPAKPAPQRIQLEEGVFPFDPDSGNEPAPMNLLLFHTRHRSLFPILGGHHFRIPPGEAGRGRWSRLRASIHSTYEALRKKFDYQERICGILRHTAEINVVHPLRMSRRQSEDELKNFYEKRRRKHLNWLGVDCVLAGLGTLLVWVPGPNIFFFYPAARALSHYLAQKGAAHVCRRSVLSFQKDPLIDEIESNWNNLQKLQPKIQKLQERYQIENLAELLRKL